MLNSLARVWRRLRNPDRLTTDLDRELEATIDLMALEEERNGLGPQDARRAAKIQLGGVAAVRSEVSESAPLAGIEALWMDSRYALRALRRAPWFSATTVLTLGLGIAAVTTAFRLVDAVLLRPLPFLAADRLVTLTPSSGSRLSAGYVEAWRASAATLDGLAAWREAPVTVTGGGLPEQLMADRVTPDFFDVLGARASLGQTFDAADASRHELDVVLSHGLWQRRYGGSEDIVGRAIVVDGRPRTIVGVMPPWFAVRTTELAESRAELWIAAPLPRTPRDMVGMGGAFHVIGRLASRATRETAQAELAAIAQRIEAENPSYSREWQIRVRDLQEATVATVRPALLMLLAGVAVLLMAACANVAGLVLTRGVTRARELSLRSALGASRARLGHLVLVESGVLVMVGGGLGLLVATWAAPLLVTSVPEGFGLPRLAASDVSPNTIWFSIALMAAVVALCGVLPALMIVNERDQWSRLPTASWPAGGLGGRRSHHELLVTLQVAMAFALVAGALLLARSVSNLHGVAPGFRPDSLLTLRVTPPESRYPTDERASEYLRAFLERVGGLPGVEAVGSAGYVPLSNFGVANQFELPGRADLTQGKPPGSMVNTVGGAFFAAMGIPLVHGRLPDARDHIRSEPVFVIDEALRARYFRDLDPIGQRMVWRRRNQQIAGVIVGVVGSTQWLGLREPSDGMTYFWAPQNPARDFVVVARAVSTPLNLVDAIRAEARQLDPDQAIGDIREAQQFLSDATAQPRFMMQLATAVGASATGLVMLGTFGMAAFWVSRRTRELGVHAALGATPRQVLALVLRRSVELLAIGLVLGALIALGVGRGLGSLLFGLSPTDAVALGVAGGVLALSVLMAAYVPARRAASIDPMVALRAE